MVIDEYYNKAIEALKDEQKAYHKLMEAGRTFDVQLYANGIDLANKAIAHRDKALNDLLTVRDKNLAQIEHNLRKHYGLKDREVEG